jgi:hypothetical protein
VLIRELQTRDECVCQVSSLFYPGETFCSPLNHRDLWALRRYGLVADLLPMVLGTDGAGTRPMVARAITTPAEE